MTLETLFLLVAARPQPGRFFSEAERRTFAAAAEVLLAGVTFDVSVSEVTDNVERFVSRSRRGWRVRALLVLVERMPLAAGQPRFSRASRDERARLLRGGLGRDGRISALCRHLRPLVLLGAYATPAARAHVGFVEVGDRTRVRLPLAVST